MRNSKKGFTIIEVVLVLAIGGLIFLMVFYCSASASAFSARYTAQRRLSALYVGYHRILKTQQWQNAI